MCHHISSSENMEVSQNRDAPKNVGRNGPVWYTIYHQLLQKWVSFKPLYQPSHGNLRLETWDIYGYPKNIQKSCKLQDHSVSFSIFVAGILGNRAEIGPGPAWTRPWAWTAWRLGSHPWPPTAWCGDRPSRPGTWAQARGATVDELMGKSTMNSNMFKNSVRIYSLRCLYI